MVSIYGQAALWGAGLGFVLGKILLLYADPDRFLKEFGDVQTIIVNPASAGSSIPNYDVSSHLQEMRQQNWAHQQLMNQASHDSSMRNQRHQLAMDTRR